MVNEKPGSLEKSGNEEEGIRMDWVSCFYRFSLMSGHSHSKTLDRKHSPPWFRNPELSKIKYFPGNRDEFRKNMWLNTGPWGAKHFSGLLGKVFSLLRKNYRKRCSFFLWRLFCIDMWSRLVEPSSYQPENNTKGEKREMVKLELLDRLTWSLPNFLTSVVCDDLFVYKPESWVFYCLQLKALYLVHYRYISSSFMKKNIFVITCGIKMYSDFWCHLNGLCFRFAATGILPDSSVFTTGFQTVVLKRKMEALKWWSANENVTDKSRLWWIS